jgi:hypothetical protein
MLTPATRLIRSLVALSGLLIGIPAAAQLPSSQAADTTAANIRQPRRVSISLGMGKELTLDRTFQFSTDFQVESAEGKGVSIVFRATTFKDPDVPPDYSPGLKIFGSDPRPGNFLFSLASRLLLTRYLPSRAGKEYRPWFTLAAGPSFFYYPKTTYRPNPSPGFFSSNYYTKTAVLVGPGIDMSATIGAPGGPRSSIALGFWANFNTARNLVGVELAVKIGRHTSRSGT